MNEKNTPLNRTTYNCTQKIDSEIFFNGFSTSIDDKIILKQAMNGLHESA